VSIEEAILVLRRRWRIFAISFALCLAAIATVTFLLPKTYQASATLFIGEEPSGTGTTLDTAQSEQIVKTYAALAANPRVAGEVSRTLGFSRSELLDKMSFTPVQQTQLLNITAEDRSPTEARNIANSYARIFAARNEGLPTPIRVSTPAVKPTSPAKPNRPLYLGLGTLLSLLFAFGVAVARDLLDRRVKIDPSEDTLLGQPILARIPLLVLGHNEDDDFSDEAIELTDVMRGDAFRILRTNLDMMPPPEPRVIMITSPGTGEGKSTIAAHLGVAAASDGDRVTLIEADLRRPGFDLWVDDEKLKEAKQGLSEYLAGKIRRSSLAVRAPGLPMLRVVWAGEQQVQPARLLRSTRMRNLISTAAADSDWVFVDTPPISVGDDASLLTAHMDGVIYVVDPGKTTLQSARSGLNQLRRTGVRVLGVVINRVQLERSQYRGYMDYLSPRD
jgi:capsular exopolysaccharide synthesis family protein